jgi:hypothetical protein
VKDTYKHDTNDTIFLSTKLLDERWRLCRAALNRKPSSSRRSHLEDDPRLSALVGMDHKRTSFLGDGDDGGFAKVERVSRESEVAGRSRLMEGESRSQFEIRFGG